MKNYYAPSRRPFTQKYLRAIKRGYTPLELLRYNTLKTINSKNSNGVTIKKAMQAGITLDTVVDEKIALEKTPSIIEIVHSIIEKACIERASDIHTEQSPH